MVHGFVWSMVGQLFERGGCLLVLAIVWAIE
jgi:hypothetical protein